MQEEQIKNIAMLSEEISLTCSGVIKTLEEKMSNAKHSAQIETITEDIENVRVVADALHSIRDDVLAGRLTRSSTILLRLINKHAREKLIRALCRIDQQKTLREGIYKKLDEIESPLSSLVG